MQNPPQETIQPDGDAPDYTYMDDASANAIDLSALQSPQGEAYPDYVPDQGDPMPYSEAYADQPTSAPPPASAAPTPARRPVMRLMGCGFAALVVLVFALIGGFSILKASRNQPLSVESYPAARVASQQRATNSDKTVLIVKAPIDKVADFYTKQLGHSDETGCKQIFTAFDTSDPKQDPIPSLKPGDSYYKCVVDESLLDTQRLLAVTITYQPASSTTQVVVERIWGNGK